MLTIGTTKGQTINTNIFTQKINNKGRNCVADKSKELMDMGMSCIVGGVVRVREDGGLAVL